MAAVSFAPAYALGPDRHPMLLNPMMGYLPQFAHALMMQGHHMPPVIAKPVLPEQGRNASLKHEDPEDSGCTTATTAQTHRPRVPASKAQSASGNDDDHADEQDTASKSRKAARKAGHVYSGGRQRRRRDSDDSEEEKSTSLRERNNEAVRRFRQRQRMAEKERSEELDALRAERLSLQETIRELRMTQALNEREIYYLQMQVQSTHGLAPRPSSSPACGPAHGPTDSSLVAPAPGPAHGPALAEEPQH
eukprot:m.34680 g.34680  ORF g.34680 m.34680 type:complete len:249 (-) comp5248_c0_seq1:199-945(-)